MANSMGDFPQADSLTAFFVLTLGMITSYLNQGAQLP